MALANGGAPDPRLVPHWRVRGSITGQDAIFRDGPMQLGERVFYGWLLESLVLPQHYALVIRGTEGIIEWVIDAEFCPRAAHPVAGEVESGFWGLYQTLRYQPINTTESLPLSSIAREVGPGWIAVIGHSLGAALATYAAFDLAADLGSHVHGCFVASPRPGNDAFARAFSQRVPHHLMLENVSDVVPKVPFGFGYCSVPNVQQLSAKTSGINLCEGLVCQHHAIIYGALCDPSLLDSFKPVAAELRYLKCLVRPDLKLTTRETTMSGIDTFFSGLWNTIKTDEEKALLPALATLANNVSLNPTVVNFVAQGNEFLATALAAQGAIETDVLKSIASTLAAAAQSVVTPPASAPAAK